MHGTHGHACNSILAGVDREVSMYRRARSLKTGQVRGQIASLALNDERDPDLKS